MGIDEPDAHYYPEPNGGYIISPIHEHYAYDYERLVKYIQQAGEHAMIHTHAEDADVFCMDQDCEVWNNESYSHECEDCGHAYSDSYGSVRVVGTTSKWLCFDCQDDRRDSD